MPQDSISLGHAPDGIQLHQVLQQHEHVPEVQIPAPSLQAVLDKRRQDDRGLGPHICHAPNIVADEQVKNQGIYEVYYQGGGRMQCCVLGLDLDAYDWSEDVCDDVMQVEDIVGEEKGYKGYQVAMDTPVDENLEWKGKHTVTREWEWTLAGNRIGRGQTNYATQQNQGGFRVQ